MPLLCSANKQNLILLQGCHSQGKKDWKMKIFPGQGKVREVWFESGKLAKIGKIQEKVRKFQNFVKTVYGSLLIFLETDKFTELFSLFCSKVSYTKVADEMAYANSADPDAFRSSLTWVCTVCMIRVYTVCYSTNYFKKQLHKKQKFRERMNGIKCSKLLPVKMIRSVCTE